MKKYSLILAALTIAFCVSITQAENIYSKEQKDTVERILRNQNRRDWGKTPAQEHAEDLKFLGDAAMPLLVTFLADYDLGYEASETMLVINAEKAAPLIFSSMPQSNRNVQYHTFKYFRRKIQNHQPFQFLSQMHTAAVRCLEADTNADAAEEALFAIGLTGGKRDFPLLEKYYNNKHPTKVWATKLQNASEAALARLGNEKYIKNIINELKAPVPTAPTLEEALTISNAIEKAAFSGDQRFVPFLCKHLDTPSFREYDYGVTPAWGAAQALNQLVNNASPDDASTSVEYWKEKCVGLCLDKKR